MVDNLLIVNYNEALTLSRDNLTRGVVVKSFEKILLSYLQSEK